MKRNSTFIIRNIGGESLLIPTGFQVTNINGFVLLNSTGKYLWELLSEDCSLEQLATSVATLFDVELERAHTDVQVFLDQIGKMGLLEND